MLADSRAVVPASPNIPTTAGRFRLHDATAVLTPSHGQATRKHPSFVMNWMRTVPTSVMAGTTRAIAHFRPATGCSEMSAVGGLGLVAICAPHFQPVLQDRVATKSLLRCNTVCIMLGYRVYHSGIVMPAYLCSIGPL